MIPTVDEVLAWSSSASVHLPALRFALREAEHLAVDPCEVPPALLYVLVKNRVFSSFHAAGAPTNTGPVSVGSAVPLAPLGRTEPGHAAKTARELHHAAIIAVVRRAAAALDEVVVADDAMLLAWIADLEAERLDLAALKACFGDEVFPLGEILS